MPILKTLVVVLTAVAPAFTADLPPASPSNQAAAAMAKSLAAQRASIARQVKQSPSESFFLLGPSSASGVALSAPGNDCDPIPEIELGSLIEGAAKQQGLQPALLRSVVKEESGFRPCAVSPKGAMGLMQLMPDTAAQLGVKDPFNPKENVDAGARFLKQLLTIYDDLPMALGAYNAGPGKVDEAGGVPKFPETMNYIQRILSTLTPKQQ
jgi:soluble lytic murein transglycosylase-like protein